MMTLFQSLCRAGQNTLQLRQLLIFLEERNIVKSSEEIKAQMIELYFASMNGEKSLLDTNRTNMDSEMIFPEFSEVLLRYAERVSPAPDSKFFEVNLYLLHK